MTPEGIEPLLPQTIGAAMAERQLLHEQFQTAVREHARRLKELVARLQQITTTFAPDEPHAPVTKEEFLRLHKTFINLMDDLKVSQLRSTALLKEIPSSRSNWQFLKNRATPTKALQHEQRVVSAQRFEFDNGMKERAVIVDEIERVIDKMQEVVDEETET
jgi:hypothetical protein